MRRLVSLFLLIALLGVVAASASTLQVDGGTIQVFSVKGPDLPPAFLKVDIDIKPESLQRKSSGNPVIAFVDLPPNVDPDSVNLSSVRLCPGTAVCGDGVRASGKEKIKQGDNGRWDMKLTFPRDRVIALVAGEPAGTTVSLAVSWIASGIVYVGSDTVKLLGPGPLPNVLDASVEIDPDTLYRPKAKGSKGSSEASGVIAFDSPDPAGDEVFPALVSVGQKQPAPEEDPEENPDEVTATVTLQEDYPAADVDEDSVRLCKRENPEDPCEGQGLSPREIVPNGDTGRFTATFNTNEVLGLVGSDKTGGFWLTVSGIVLADEGDRTFAGKHKVTVKEQSKGGSTLLANGLLPSLLLIGATPTATPGVTPTTGPTIQTTATPTSFPLLVSVGTPSAVLTQTAVPTATATGVPALAPTRTAAPTKTATPAPTATPEATATAAPTLTETPVATGTVATATPTGTPVATETATPTATSTALPSATATPTGTPAPTETPVPTPAPTEPPSPTATPAPTETPAPTGTPTEPPSPTATPTRAPTETPVPAATATATATPTYTPAAVPTPTGTPTATPTSTRTPAPSPTGTPAPPAPEPTSGS